MTGLEHVVVAALPILADLSANRTSREQSERDLNALAADNGLRIVKLFGHTDVKKVFTSARLELYGGGGTDIGVGLRWFTERKGPAIDLLVVVSDCQTPWPAEAPPFPVITIRVGDGAPPPWGNRGANKVITIEEPSSETARVGGGSRCGNSRWALSLERSSAARRCSVCPSWLKIAALADDDSTLGI